MLPNLPTTAEVDSRVGRDFLNALRINFIPVDTSTGPKTVDLAAYAGPMIVIKDVGGMANTNPITITGTVDGSAALPINTAWGVARIVAIRRSWYSW